MKQTVEITKKEEGRGLWETSAGDDEYVFNPKFWDVIPNCG